MRLGNEARGRATLVPSACLVQSEHMIHVWVCGLGRTGPGQKEC